MVVAESEQGQGIGSQLLRHAEHVLSEKGCRLIVADVYPPAEPFYKKHDWDTPSALLMSRVF